MSKLQLKEAEKRKIVAAVSETFQVLPGKGIAVQIDGHKVLVGNHKLFKDRHVEFSHDAKNKLAEIEKKAQTILHKPF